MVQLFDGAFRAELPGNFLNASALRQIPDNQEVFLQDSKENLTLILELLEQVEKPQDATVAKFHFDSIAYDNDASESIIWKDTDLSQEDIAGLNNERAIGTCTFGCQKVFEKGKKMTDVASNVAVLVHVITLQEFETDVVCSVNIPLSQTLSFPKRLADVSPADEAALQTANQILSQFTHSLVLVDRSLFFAA
ncbi:ran GTPase binding protein Mog1 [Schizosaccharomyces cryophilus OY26]|uniref:Ran GTPase binding protein Mog1 n=1 Tax=Schizosaccharomyces cryophilus (strain OY26 / ATCC MYA-4695 / CBS 11777 / NBRC 106824 / NRRL Y48691) TaxID=653667 RepID=S9X224_SCHCR|nr:ran GTPase binding protein Mog1 [Schizosaccharomyces cryophilus OY26]EPY51162.1 ran GTPase binding protein Mog1 [Schizosaccharomyces cryophilus OY26]